MRREAQSMQLCRGSLAFLAAAPLIIALLGASPAMAKAPSAEAVSLAKLEHAILACRSIADTSARVACYDKLAVAAPPAESAFTVPAPPPQAQSTAAPPSALDIQPAPTHVATMAQREGEPQWTSESLRNDTREITLEIANVGVTPDHMLSMVTSDGILWEQTQERPIHQWPSAGDEVEISRSLLGYECRLNKHDSFHCKPPHGLDGKMP